MTGRGDRLVSEVTSELDALGLNPEWEIPLEQKNLRAAFSHVICKPAFFIKDNGAKKKK